MAKKGASKDDDFAKQFPDAKEGGDVPAPWPSKSTAPGDFITGKIVKASETGGKQNLGYIDVKIDDATVVRHYLGKNSRDRLTEAMQDHRIGAFNGLIGKKVGVKFLDWVDVAGGYEARTFAIGISVSG